MLIIYTQSNHSEELNQLLSKSEEELHQIVAIKDLSDLPKDEQSLYLIVENGKIKWPIDWYDRSPPLLLPFFSLTKNNVYTLIFTKLGHFDLARKHCKEPYLLNFIDRLESLLEGQGYSINAHALPNSSLDYEELHNTAVAEHYSNREYRAKNCENSFLTAIDHAPNSESQAFTTHHFSIYLLDIGEIEKAEKIVRSQLGKQLSEKASNVLELDLVKVLMQKLTVPYDFQLVEELKERITNTLSYFQKTGLNYQVAMLLVDASEIANIQQQYSESLGYINQAIALLEKEDLPEFLSSAFMRKGTLLYTWAQNGNPQFYKVAIETYQKALGYFRKDNAPSVFADIHHNLGVIYAEIVTDEKQQNIFAAISASSFKESLSFYNEKDYPYEFAMVANNYANALAKYPPAKKSDNLEKAIHFYNKALEIRTAKHYPFERSLTILNYLEACWRANNVNNLMERVRLKDMTQKANEVVSLAQDKDLVDRANEHLEKLKELGQLLAVS